MVMMKLDRRGKLELCKIKRGPKIEVDGERDGNARGQWHNE